MSRPAYQYLSREELRERVRRALATLEECRACPRDCGVNRLEDKWAACKTGRYALVGSYFPHFGEEDCLRGWNGSGTIFFSHCNLRCVFCTVPGTRVTTSEGLLPIEEIFARGRETDREEVRLLDGKVRVLTREGRWAPVAKAFRHHYEGELVRLKPFCCPPLLLTPNHRVHAVARWDPARLLEVPAGAVSTDHRVIVPARAPARPAEVGASSDLRFDPLSESTPEGREITLEVTDLLAEERPVRRLREARLPARELVTLFSQRWTSARLGEISGYHPAYLRKLRGRWIRGAFGEADDVRQTENPLVVEEGAVRFATERRPGIPVRLTVDRRLAWLLGFYCAEGHVTSQHDRPNSHRLVFSLGHSELERAERVRRLLQDLFAVRAELRRRRTTYTVEVGKASLALLFRRLCGKGAREKRVPPLLRGAGRGVLEAFLEGVSAGDGWEGPSHTVIATVSEELAVGLFELGLFLGMLPSVHRHERPRTTRIEGRTVNQSPSLFRVAFPKIDAETGGRRSRWKETPLGYLLPLHKIERVSYAGPVYNLEVDDREHSYLAPFVAVANCQNWEISQAIKPHAAPPGSRPEEIAAMMLELQGRGCHNINFVTPEHVVPQVVEAVALAVEGGLRLPIVYNTSAYDALESLELMDGIVDIYMPDFKYWSEERSRTYMKAADYPEAARAAVKEMHRQVGNLVVDADGMARRGLILRHLVMPGFLDETREILRWVAEELGPDTYVNLMDQYYPAGAVGEDRYPEIDRRLSPEEFEKARAMARELGLRRLDARRPHPRLLRRRLAVLWE